MSVSVRAKCNLSLRIKSEIFFQWNFLENKAVRSCEQYGLLFCYAFELDGSAEFLFPSVGHSK
jgi:hypothetical protein